ncbi:MAG: Kelch repeat-containing protein [Actinomycetota bacterium]
MRPTTLAVALVLAACTAPDGAVSASSSVARPFEWRRLSPAPTARTEPVAAVDGDGLVVLVGGFGSQSQTVATVEIYDPAKDRWISGPSLPIAVNHAMAATVGETVYVMGGYTSSGAPSSQAFALNGGQWQPLPPMPEPRAAGGAAAAAGNIYVAGGIGSSGLATSTLVFDPGTGSWSTAPGLRAPREHLGVAAFGARVYVVGGRTGAGDLADAEMFDPVSGSWSPLPDMPTARGGLAAGATANGFIVAPGGEELTPGGATYPDVEAFDVERERWISLPPMPSPRHGLGVVAIGETLYTLAGGPEPGLTFSSTVEAIDVTDLESLECAGKQTTVVGSPGPDVLTGTEATDVVASLDGNDVLEGGAGRDYLCGGPGDDRLVGGSGRDRLVGGSGRDRCIERGNRRLTSCER